MWKVGSAGNDPVVLADLLDRFTLWTALRIGLVDISFVCVVVATIAALVPQRDRASRAP